MCPFYTSYNQDVAVLGKTKTTVRHLTGLDFGLGLASDLGSDLGVNLGSDLRSDFRK